MQKSFLLGMYRGTGETTKCIKQIEENCKNKQQKICLLLNQNMIQLNNWFF
jgi:hypothetical protein